MSQFTADLTVAYRVYPRVSGAPFIHGDDKLQLARLCFTSFVRALGPLRVHLCLLLDGCPPEYEAAFRVLWEDRPLDVLPRPGVGNRETFRHQIALLAEESNSDVVYFAEDDYLYQPDALHRLWRFLRDHPDDFVTPYDHADYYAPIHLHRHAFPLAVGAEHHWRQAVYSCLTFMTTRATVRRYRAVLETYARGAPDTAMWMALTKYNVSPYHLLRYVVRERGFLFPVAWQAWRYSWRQILFGRRARLWAPMPSFATHAERHYLAPAVDWLALASAVTGPD